MDLSLSNLCIQVGSQNALNPSMLSQKQLLLASTSNYWEEEPVRQVSFKCGT